jgi:UMF1 family MFS transporter
MMMLTLPAIGAYADLRAAKKRLLAAGHRGCVLAAPPRWRWPGRATWAGDPRGRACPTSLFVRRIADAAFLPELARPAAMGRVSGWGWSFGYFGGMLALGLGLAYVLSAQAAASGASSFVPVTMLITAAVYALASLADLHAAARARPPSRADWRQSGLAAGGRLSRLATPGGRAAVSRLLVAARPAARYQAGISVVIALAAVYAEQVLGFKQIRHDAADLPGQHRVGGRRLRLRLLAGPHRSQACAGGHPAGLDRDGGAGRAGPSARLVLGGGRDRRPVHGIQPVGRRARWPGFWRPP